jgi:hypothetical protein
VITCRATPGAPVELLRLVTRLLILERRRRCTPAGSRALTCREQAVTVLRRFRDRARAGQPGRVTSVKGEAIDARYSGKHHRPGGNVQAVIRPDGLPLRASPAEPGHVHDITAARVHALPPSSPPNSSTDTSGENR